MRTPRNVSEIHGFDLVRVDIHYEVFEDTVNHGSYLPQEDHDFLSA